MKLAIQRLLVCPECHSSLELEIFRKDEDEVMEGRFRCTCDLEYPIIHGVPRLLPPDLLPSLKDDYPEYFELYGRSQPHTAAPRTAHTRTQRRTQQAFGYEWTWAAEYHADNFSDWLPADFDAKQGFTGKLGLEVGCGAGRHAAATARLAEQHVAVDLSRAVDSAFARTRFSETVMSFRRMRCACRFRREPSITSTAWASSSTCPAPKPASELSPNNRGLVGFCSSTCISPAGPSCSFSSSASANSRPGFLPER